MQRWESRTLPSPDKRAGRHANALSGRAQGHALRDQFQAARGRWLTEKLCERSTPDGRTVLELVDEPIWARADGTFADYCAAVDAAMEADDGWATA